MDPKDDKPHDKPTPTVEQGDKKRVKTEKPPSVGEVKENDENPEIIASLNFSQEDIIQQFQLAEFDRTMKGTIYTCTVGLDLGPGGTGQVGNINMISTNWDEICRRTDCGGVTGQTKNCIGPNNKKNWKRAMKLLHQSKKDMIAAGDELTPARSSN